MVIDALIYSCRSFVKQGDLPLSHWDEGEGIGSVQHSVGREDDVDRAADRHHAEEDHAGILLDGLRVDQGELVRSRQVDGTG